MIQHGILELDAIYKMLGPADDVIQAEAEKAMSEAKEFVRKMNIVSTKDKDEKADEVNSEANKKVRIIFFYLTYHIYLLLSFKFIRELGPMKELRKVQTERICQKVMFAVFNFRLPSIINSDSLKLCWTLVPGPTQPQSFPGNAFVASKPLRT